MRKIYLFIVASISSCTFAQTTTISIPLSQGAGADSYLASAAPSTNYGSHPDIGGNTWTCNNSLCNSRGVFKFDLSGVPTTITSAYLALYADVNWSATPTTGTANAGYLRRVTTAWNENAVTWNTQPSTTTTNQVTIPASTTTAQNYTVNVTALVQDMLSTTNNGFMLQMQDELNYYKALMFASSNHTNTAKVPVLTITYNTAGISTHSNNQFLEVYPNPSTSGFTLASDKVIEKVVIHNSVGSVSSQMLVNDKRYETGSSLAPGIYYATIYFEDKTSAVKKIVKL